MIEPRRGRNEEAVPPAVILGFTRWDLATMRRALGLEGVGGRPLDAATLWVCREPWTAVGLAGPAMGAPAAALLLERLIALGARAVAAVGSCGSLQPRAPIGSVILPTGSLVEEGTSPHYLAPWVSTTPDPGLLARTRGALERAGVEPLEGRVWTTDAPFRETVEKVVTYQREGVLAVDMEASAMMTVSSFRRVPLVSVLVVSDEIGTLRWRRGFHDASYRDRLVLAARTAASVLAEPLLAGVAGGDVGEPA